MSLIMDKTGSLKPNSKIHKGELIMRVRKSTTAMSTDEWQAYNAAINQLVESGKWAELTFYHAEVGGNHRMHGSMSGSIGYARFLYWHRAFLVECENAFREIDESITIPYWDWLNAETIPQGLNHMPITGVSRNPGIIDFTNQAEIQEIKERDTFDSFVRGLENNPHNSGHNWVGGIMSNPMDSPRDPLFYMHHANIDRIWNDWQNILGNGDKKPVVSDEDSLLDPWENTWNINNVHDISDLGENSYNYAPDTVIDRNSEIFDRLRRLEELNWPEPIPTPWPRPFPPNPFPGPWPPVPSPRPAPPPWPGPRPDPISNDVGALSQEEMAMVRVMRSFRNQ